MLKSVSVEGTDFMKFTTEHLNMIVIKRGSVVFIYMIVTSAYFASATYFITHRHQ